MSWHYSLGPGAVCSVASYLDGIRSERLKSTPTVAECCCSDSATDTCLSSQSGTTLQPSTPSPGGDALTSCPADSPAKTLALPAEGPGLMERVRACGESIAESLKNAGLSLSLRKTPRTCGPADLAESSKTLPAWGTMLAGELWELGTLAPPTADSECGYWPTPTANDAKGGRAVPPDARWVGLTTCYRNDGKKLQIGLQTAVRKIEPGPLNPGFSEWLMGWPIGWTESRPLETAKFQQWWQLHSAFCQAG
jgi:hypothetical protein